MFVMLGALSALVAVAAGAFAAHGLKDSIPADMLAIFETGARYQMYHSLALVLIGVLAARLPGRSTAIAGWLLAAGIVVFSGSLYLLALTGVKWLGAITPLGGAAFLAGWAALAFAAWKDRLLTPA